MPVDVVTETIIERPAREVFALAADPDQATRWYENIKAVQWVTPPPLRQGSQVQFVADFLWKELVYTYEVVELVEGRRMTMRTAAGPFPMETQYEVEPVSEGASRMRLRNRGTPSGFFRLLAPFLSMAMRKANQKDLRRLKTLLESGL